jgi:ArsR family transcriptional regulator
MNPQNMSLTAMLPVGLPDRLLTTGGRAGYAESGGKLCILEPAEGEKLTTVPPRLKSLLAVRPMTRRRDAKHILYALADDHVPSLIRSAVEHAAERR